jgi:hypothetical protein
MQMYAFGAKRTFCFAHESGLNCIKADGRRYSRCKHQGREGHSRGAGDFFNGIDIISAMRQAQLDRGRLRGEETVDKRFETFVKDVLALEGKPSNLVREAVRMRLAKCERQVRRGEKNESMKNRAAEMCDRLCRARIIDELQQCRGTLTAVHLQTVHNVVDGTGRVSLKSG